MSELAMQFSESLGDEDAVIRDVDASRPSMIARMTIILDAFDNSLARLSLEEITSRAGLPRSTTHRILEQLMQFQWINRVGNFYHLGPRALNLGGQKLAHSELRAAAYPRLHELALRTGLVAHLAIFDEFDIYYLDKFAGKSVSEVPSQIGERVLPHCTALGKGILAWLPPERVEEQFGRMIRVRTSRTIADIRILHQELGRIRSRNGIAFDRGECFSHLACVGVAIRNSAGPVAAISVVGGSNTLLERLAPTVLANARAISNELTGQKRPALSLTR